MFTTLDSLSPASIAAAASGTRDFVVYGSGMYGQRLAAILARYGHQVRAYTDANPALWGTFIKDVPILSPADAGRKFGEATLFIIALARYSLLPEAAVRKDVVALLERYGCCHIAFVPSLHEMIGRFDCESAGVDVTEDPIRVNGAALPNFFLHADASIRNDFGLILSETLLPKTDANNSFYGRPYELPGLTDLRAGEVVADCGANLGVFSAHAASRGCTVHAFEPIPELAELLMKTAALYPGKIHVHREAVSSDEGECVFTVSRLNAAWSVKGTADSTGNKGDTITVRTTSLDRFAERHNLAALDYIKSDIEGDERNMLRGARGVLSRFAPRLALSSYHLPDDPQVMEAEILAANPAYRIRHLDDKLYAAPL